MSFLKKNKGIIIASVVAFILGIGAGGSGITQEELDSVKLELEGAKSEIVKVEDELLKTEEEVKGLEGKVAEAKPFFEMQEVEKETMRLEAEKKAEENKKEEARIAEEKIKEEEAKKQAELDARSVTLGNGTYLVGKDIPEGVYDLYAVKGGGNVISPRQANFIMGVTGNEDMYQREQQNVALKNETTIELRGVTVKFVPDDGYVINN